MRPHLVYVSNNKFSKNDFEVVDIIKCKQDYDLVDLMMRLGSKNFSGEDIIIIKQFLTDKGACDVGLFLAILKQEQKK